MAIKRILLSLPTYPDPAPEPSLTGAFTMAQILGVGLTVQLPQLSSDRTSWPTVLGAFPLDFPQLMDEIVELSRANADATLEALSRLARDFGIALDIRRCLSPLYGNAAPMVDLARLHDLLVLPVPETDEFGRSNVQAALFGTGRPVLLLPSGPGHKILHRLDRVMVAWDYSRAAARALADALPILSQAKDVHIVSVFGEKGIDTTCTKSDLDQYLSAQNVKYALHQPVLEQGEIGQFLAGRADEFGADMLVMGAYGHSRLHEFALGGATRGILADPPLPVLLSH